MGRMTFREMLAGKTVETKMDEAITKIALSENEMKRIFKHFIGFSTDNSMAELKGVNYSELEEFKKAQKCSDLIIVAYSKDELILAIK